MNIELYVSASDTRKLNKSITLLASVYANLKDEVNSKTDPTLIFSYATTPAMKSHLNRCNYIYIPDFDRYYFVREINVLEGRRVEFICHVDVLMSYKTQLNDLECIVERGTTAYNEYLVDNKLPCLNYKAYEVTEFSGQFNNELQYVLAVCGGEG